MIILCLSPNWVKLNLCLSKNHVQKACKRKVRELFSIRALSWGQVDDVGQILLSVTLVWISVELVWIYTDVAEKKTCPLSFLSSVTALLNPGLHLRPASSYELPDFTMMPAGISLLIWQCLVQSFPDGFMDTPRKKSSSRGTLHILSAVIQQTGPNGSASAPEKISSTTEIGV